MLIFFAQVENPDDEDKKRFERIKKKIAIVFRQMKRTNDKDLLICKIGQNWIAIHRFRQQCLG